MILSAASDIVRELGEVWGAIDIQQQSPPDMPGDHWPRRPSVADPHDLARDRLALLPLALGAGEPGRDIEGSIAVVLLGVCRRRSR